MKKTNLKLTPYHFEEFVNKGHSLDHIFLLMLVDEGIDLSEYCENNVKINVLYQGLIRKGFITNDNKVTNLGKEMIAFLATRGKASLAKKANNSTEFDRWWKAYPGTDTFTHNYKSFVGHRSLRINKDDCRIKFNKILLEGEYTADQLIKATEIDVLQKKEASVKQVSNKLSYMQNSLTYLNQRSFEPFIELIDTDIQTNSSGISKTVDI